MQQYVYYVSGRVQGVGYRQFIYAGAQALGVRGYVRNRPDGSVECQAAGSEAELDRLEALLRRGPPHARVERVERQAARDELPANFIVTS